jgi:hypothetical protein
MAFLFKAAGRQRWISVLVWSGGVSIVTYLLFKVWLQVQFPVGLFGV